MNVISLWQPWATWIAAGLKTIETRRHNRLAGLVGQRIGIHAAVTYDEGAWTVAGRYIGARERRIASSLEYPRGAVVCTGYCCGARLLGSRSYDSYGALCDCDGRELYGLFLADVEPVLPPLPARGHRGIWRISDDLILLRTGLCVEKPPH